MKAPGGKTGKKPCTGLKICGSWRNLFPCKDFPGFWILERCNGAVEETGALGWIMRQFAAAAEKVRDNRTFIDISDDRFRVSGG